MEAEARELLTAGIDAGTPEARKEENVATAIHRRFAAVGGVDLEIPPREFNNGPIPTFD
jgi:antitoxin FitA